MGSALRSMGYALLVLSHPGICLDFALVCRCRPESDSQGVRRFRPADHVHSSAPGMAIETLCRFTFCVRGTEQVRSRPSRYGRVAPHPSWRSMGREAEKEVGKSRPVPGI